MDSLAYWTEALAGNPPALELPLTYARTADQAHRAATVERSITTAGADSLEAWTAAWFATLHRTTRQTDLVIGVVDGSSVMPLRANLAEASWQSLVGQVESGLTAGRPHGDVDVAALATALEAESAIQVGLTMAGRDAGALPGDLDFVLHVEPQGASATVRLTYNAELFDEATASRALGHLETLLAAALASPDAAISGLPFLTDAESEQILVTWNDKVHDFPMDATLHSLFEANAAANPDAVAAVFQGQSMTYGQLDERANRLAHHLISLGVKIETLVGISAERSFEMVVGLMAIAKAGAAYVPMDPAYPRERIAYMVEDSGVPVILTQRHLADSIPESQAKVVFLDDPKGFADQSTDNPDVGATSDNLSYVIYTSGSTGAPKGVVLNHQGRVNNFLDFNRRFSVAGEDRLIALASLSFDMCAYDVFGILAAGAGIVLPEPENMQDPVRWARLMNEQKVTVWHTAPAMLKMLVDHLEANPAEAPQSLRLVLLGGDWIPVTLPDRLRALVSDVQVISMGGATECSMDSTIYEILEVDPDWNSIPYGEPMTNQLAYVLDDHLQPLPIGVPGELYLGGIGVGRGYFNRPELTAERFLKNPFRDGERIYRTGDLARWMPDGNLELLGRMDNQVKIRGYRIELGEIESRMREHAAVREGVVVARDDAAGEKRLVAYIVQDSAWTGPEDDADALGSEQVEQWAAVYDNAYSATDENKIEDPTFNIVSWDSSYTNQALPPEQMKLWVEQTVDRIKKCNPTEVLEIGCGMGLLLFRIAPQCKRYIGTDFSKVALDYVAKHRNAMKLEQVELDKRWADDFKGIDENSLDSIVLNSIILDFPSMDYLMEVLEGSVKAVRPGGVIFVGDVRSKPMIEVYQSSVQLFQAEADTPVEQIKQRVQRLIRQEEELVIDPAFFAWLKTRFPKIASVQIQQKRGSFQNELNKFRYDVTIHIGDDPRTPKCEAVDLDWDRDGVSMESVRQKLENDQPELLVVREVPNGRVAADVVALRLLHQKDGPTTVGAIRDAVAADPASQGINPEDVWALGDELGYAADVRWAASTTEGRVDIALFRPSESAPLVIFPDEAGLPVDQGAQASDFANNPMMGKLSRQIGPELRRHLGAQLPEYMVPVVYVPLDAMPLSPNGKVDRKSLPEPDTSRPDIESAYQAPESPIEEVVAGIWADVLGLDRVGVNDAFLDLGGHSLLAVQIQARLNEILPFEISLPDIFESRTVAVLAQHIDVQGAKNGVDMTEVCVMLQEIEQMSDEEVQSRIGSD